jgi:hypothetical protein
LLFPTFFLMSLISILEHQFMGIQSPDIMADSADTKQMLVTSNSELDWPNSLYSSHFELDLAEYLIHWKIFSLNTLMNPVLERLHKPH